jgi:hypothetical protein
MESLNSRQTLHPGHPRLAAQQRKIRRPAAWASCWLGSSSIARRGRCAPAVDARLALRGQMLARQAGALPPVFVVAMAEPGSTLGPHPMNIRCISAALGALLTLVHIGFSSEVPIIKVSYFEKLARKVHPINHGDPFTERDVAVHKGKFTVVGSMALDGLDPNEMLVDGGFRVQVKDVSFSFVRRDAKQFGVDNRGKGKAKWEVSAPFRSKSVPEVVTATFTWKDDVLTFSVHGKYYITDYDGATYGSTPIAGEYLGDQTGEVIAVENCRVSVVNDDDPAIFRVGTADVSLGVSIKTTTKNIDGHQAVESKVGVLGGYRAP